MSADREASERADARSASLPTSAPLEDAALEGLVLRYLELVESGEEPDLAELCAERPELLPALEETLGHLPSDDDPWLDRVLGERYRIESRLGAGGMGLVFGARDLELERDVAIKILEDVWSQDPERRARFLREARTVAGLEHPGIVAVHDASFDSTPPFVVFERVEGVDLAHWIAELRAQTAAGDLPTPKGEARPWAELVARGGIEMARTLQAAHDCNVLHRDVKPANFMRDAAGRVRLLDFGLARREQDPSLTRTSASVGSPLYMPPEVLRGQTADPASDVYSLGATLYELACLSPAFEGHGRELEHRILHDEAVPLHERCRRLPRALSAIVHRCLHKDPAKRYASAGALADDLQRFVDFEPVDARASWWPRPMRRALGTWRRHRGAIRAVTAVTVIAAIGVVVWGNVRGDDLAQAAAKRDRERSRLHSELSPTLGLDGSRDERLADPTRAAHLQALRRLAELEGGKHPAHALLALVESESGKERAPDPAPDWAAAFVLLRDRHQHRGGVARAARDARVHLEGLGDALPEFLRARLLGFAALESGAFADVLGIAERHEARFGQTALGAFLRGTALAALDRDRAGALSALDRANRLCPGHVPTAFMRARQLRRLRRPHEAYAALRLPLDLRPEHVTHRELEVLILRDLADAATSSTEAETHRKAIEERLAAWHSDQRERGLLARGNYELWRALRATSDPARHLDAALAAFAPLDSSDNPRVRLAARRNRSLAQGLRKGDKALYLDTLWRRVLEHPRDAVLLRNLAQAIDEAPDASAARAKMAAVLLVQALAAEPDNFESRARLIRSLTDIDPELALEQILRCSTPADHGDFLVTFAKKNLALLDSSRRRAWRVKLRNAGIGGKP